MIKLLILLNLISINIWAGPPPKELKGVVISYDDKVVQFAQGQKKYYLDNTVLKYKSHFSKCDEVFVVSPSTILKVEKLVVHHKFACKEDKAPPTR